MSEEKFLHDEKAKRYELHLDDGVAFVQYLINSQGVVYLTHTEVPDELGGRGVGSRLVEYILADIKANKRKVYPQCPFVRAYINKHNEWMELLE